ncbi:S16 family serine protease [Streptomyces sp. NPDC018045]|uniref:S16 family serine protease n=1 Tax=Streptomyces sp. NPDC018045 TaxID=3365037 RepID=UPI0037A7D07E
MSSRTRALGICAALVIALLATVAFAPLPFSVAFPGDTADVLGKHKGKQVITISGAPTRETSGQLRMAAIVATGPDAPVRLPDVVKGWFRTDQAVMPVESVYPVGDTAEKAVEHNLKDMRSSQDVATRAALNYLHKSDKDVRVRLDLGTIGGPSAGLLFSLGIIDKLVGDGKGGDLTGGRKIAGTGTITADGEVGAVGGVSLKTQAAGRDGATVFLVPRSECKDAQAELPEGLRLVPVSTLSGTVDALKALKSGGKVPSC